MTMHMFENESDYASMRALSFDAYDDGTLVYCTVGDLDWWRATSDPTAIRRAALWTNPAGQVIGFAWPNAGQIDMVSHPHHRAIEGDMLAWAEASMRAEATGSPPMVRARCFAADAARSTLLHERGYGRTDEFYVFHRRDLSDTLPAPVLPPGYTLRHIASDADLEQRVAVHRSAFAPSKMTVEKHRAVMNTPTYRPDLDLVAVAPDGSFAAFCIVWFDQHNQIGVFEPVGCHTDHQRLGLGRAVLHEGMRRLQDLGAHTANVISLGDDGASALLYRATGFQEVGRDFGWEKQL